MIAEPKYYLIKVRLNLFIMFGKPNHKFKILISVVWAMLRA
jgi:hypothetical protein